MLMNKIENGLEGWEADQFYRVVLAMITAAVVAVMLMIFSAVAQPTKIDASAAIAEGLTGTGPDSSSTGQRFVVTEWW